MNKMQDFYFNYEEKPTMYSFVEGGLKTKINLSNQAIYLKYRNSMPKNVNFEMNIEVFSKNAQKKFYFSVEICKTSDELDFSHCSATPPLLEQSVCLDPDAQSYVKVTWQRKEGNEALNQIAKELAESVTEKIMESFAGEHNIKSTSGFSAKPRVLPASDPIQTTGTTVFFKKNGHIHTPPNFKRMTQKGHDIGFF